MQKAAQILNDAEKPVILVGQGALKAGDEIVELAEKLGAPIVKALLGKAVVPDDHPLTTGGLGLLGTTPSQNAMENCDALLMIGMSRNLDIIAARKSGILSLGVTYGFGSREELRQKPEPIIFATILWKLRIL
ncbi:MAG: hypothetical protein ACR2N3_04330 [Pyrinomonadaceae bacterium]